MLKPRPLITKFIYTTERDTVKRAGRELKGTDFSIAEQFPEDVSSYRRGALLPLLRDTRKNNNRAYMTVDKLNVDDALQRAPSSPYRVQQPIHNTR